MELERRETQAATLEEVEPVRDGDVPSDRALKATVVSRLRENPYTQDFRIRVDVHAGVVHLGGQVASPVACRAATEDAGLVAGVVAVDSELVVAA